MAGSDNFAPVVMPGSGQIPLSMVAETGSGMSQRLTLDRSSFEKLLAAAWVLQCLHDQLHNQEVGRDEAVAGLANTPEPLRAANSGSPAVVETVAQPSPGVICAVNMPDVLTAPSADDKVLAGVVVVQLPAGIGALRVDATAKVDPEVEPATNLHTTHEATFHASRPALPVLATVANDERKERTRPAFDRYISDLRAAFSRTLDTFTNLRPALRVNLTLPALRAVAIATPVLILGVVAASLLFETWHHEPVNSAETISRSSAPTAPAAVNVISTTRTTTKHAASKGRRRDHKKVTDNESKQPSSIPPPQSSHKEVTDPAALSAVHGLSRYEIKGLRRQAKYGDPSAAFTLGMAYEVGRHVPQNCAEAARWVVTAAEAGNPAAEYNLGLRYRDGDGVPANRAESEKWLRRAASRRYPKANLALKMLAAR
jgi:TPR repeat protein